MAELPSGLDWNTFRTAYSRTQKSTRSELKSAYREYRNAGRSRTSPKRASKGRASPTRGSGRGKPAPPRKESVGRSPPKGSVRALPAPRRDTEASSVEGFDRFVHTLDLGERFDQLLNDSGFIHDVEEADVVTVFLPVRGFSDTFSQAILVRLLAGSPIRLAGHPLVQRVLRRHILYRTMPTETENVELGGDRCTVDVTEGVSRVACPGIPRRRVGSSESISNGMVYYIAKPLITTEEEYELGRLVLETHLLPPKLAYRERKQSTSPRKVKTSLERPRAADAYNPRTVATVGEGEGTRYVITEPYAISVGGSKPRLLRMTEREWVDVEDKLLPVKIGIEGVEEDRSILEGIDATLERVLVDNRTHTVAFVLRPGTVRNRRRGALPASVNVVLDKLDAKLAAINRGSELDVGGGRRVMIGIAKEELE
jgi:hypothetical protein